MHLPPPAQVATVPVVMRDRVVNLIYVHPHEGRSVPADVQEGLSPLANAAAEAFARLIKSRKSS